MADDQAPVMNLTVAKESKPKKSKKKVTKKTSRGIVTIRNVQMAVPFVDAGLALLEQVKKVKPYAKAARVLTSAGVAVAAASNNEQPHTAIIEKIRVVRGQVIAYEAAPEVGRDKLVGLRAQLDTLIDLLLEQ
jgi:hypothetical protein